MNLKNKNTGISSPPIGGAGGLIIAIDPDVEKNGVAYLEPATLKLEVLSLTFPQLLDYLQTVNYENELTDNKKILIVVEAGWLNQISNFHTAAGRKGQRIAKNVGANHEVGKKIVEMARHYGFEVVEQKPLKKIWKGKDGKITHEELAAFTSITKKTSQDGRDAALIAWTFAGLPNKKSIIQ
jgi:hypothetical protein